MKLVLKLCGGGVRGRRGGEHCCGDDTGDEIV